MVVPRHRRKRATHLGGGVRVGTRRQQRRHCSQLPTCVGALRSTVQRCPSAVVSMADPVLAEVASTIRQSQHVG